jgi:hypothetical protein
MRNLNTRILLITLLFVTMGLATACQTQAVEPSEPAVAESTTLSEPAATPTSAVPSAKESRQAIVQALMALYSKPNRMSVTTALDGGETHNNVIEFLPPDRKHIISQEEGVEYIVVGEQVFWYTESGGKWEETDIPAAAFMGDSEVTETSISEAVNDPEFLREDALDGRPMVIFSYLNKSGTGDLEQVAQVELWIGKEDGLPYKMIMDGDVISIATDPATGESETTTVPSVTTTLITFDSSISIEVPVP